ncbi:diguanylate cyclase [Jiella sp. MQZ9-1]|uniref:Diguanylate cyclase n=2 Tax=Jiella flava TaxID=2816857 RepID=A0A939FU80_9HYPH|nr:diguanylate cyclase [Jiella flava]MCD2470640.1 diguanylate cyclase [Jiella flava]
MVEFSTDGRIIFANPNFLKLMQYSEEEVIGQHHRIFLRPEDRDNLQYQAFWELLKAGEFIRRDFRRVTKGGREVWLQASYNPILSRDGKAHTILKLATDITAEKQRAANHESTLQAISRSTAMIEFAMNGTILSVNANFAAIMGYEVQELLGRNHRDFVPPEIVNSSAYTNFWNRLRTGEFAQAEFPRIAKNGRIIWLQASYNPILDASGQPTTVMKIATDITARLTQNAKAERLALLDQLTGISNRRGFDLALSATMSEFVCGAGPLSLLMLDVDHFKTFNDNYGHQVGDRCLQVVAKAIELAVYDRPNSLVARYGGEEFAVLLPGTDLAETAEIAEAVRAGIASLRITHSGNPSGQSVTASIGSATLRLDEETSGSIGSRDLVELADKALYAAKHQGRNRVVDAGERTRDNAFFAFPL